jgi:hypothetical protein
MDVPASQVSCHSRVFGSGVVEQSGRLEGATLRRRVMRSPVICGAPPVARFATPIGLRPPFVAQPATLPHPDRRALLILFAAQHRRLDCIGSKLSSCGDSARIPRMKP